MNLLAIEQSTRKCSIALTCDGETRAHLGWDSSTVERQHLYEKLPEVLKKGALRPDAIDHYVIGLGPGAFSGIRSAIATCRGLAQPDATPVSGIASTAIMAFRALQTDPTSHIHVIGDARRERYWHARYAWVDGRLDTRQDPQLREADALQRLITAEDVVLSPDYDRITNILATLATKGCRVTEAASVPDARDLSALALDALAAGETLSDPVPVYLHPAVFVAPRFPATPKTDA
ncbi:MAG: tRNA (adenosine(37)-N6)-threonylcarbamoyltransferase complex dimerization subunit type 1 TsaB [Kiritimatiellae bacterium]|nr:tRNA (adenosine(37)-N6)-threonylcarbamoyltransferase complex dimerization subunit type 1 TsaB [Kiritimatiellia bacterium]